MPSVSSFIQVSIGVNRHRFSLLPSLIIYDKTDAILALPGEQQNQTGRKTECGTKCDKISGMQPGPVPSPSEDTPEGSQVSNIVFVLITITSFVLHSGRTEGFP